MSSTARIHAVLGALGTLDAFADDPGHLAGAVEELEPLDRFRVLRAARVIVAECERVDQVEEALLELQAAVRPQQARKRTDQIEELIQRAVADTMHQQAAAIEAMVPVAMKRGIGVSVLTATDGTWRVQLDDELPPRTIGHRAVDVLPPLAGEERSTDAD